MPDLGVVDFESIDAILISNYTTMLALPFITEETPFNGNIYITEPTLHFGRLFMEETIEFLEQCSPRSSAKSLSSMPIWKTYSQHLPGNLQSIGREQVVNAHFCYKKQKQNLPLICFSL